MDAAVFLDNILDLRHDCHWQFVTNFHRKLGKTPFSSYYRETVDSDVSISDESGSERSGEETD